jgi:hypothetical protein
VSCARRCLLPHHLDMRPHLHRTLEAIKQTAETAATTPDPTR